MHFVRCSTINASATVSAKCFLFKLCGTSQPAIIQGTDGAFYVVKFHGYPGPNSLVSEVVGSKLIAMLGLPAPAWLPIEISSEFISANPGMWFTSENSVISPRPGIHFGSRLIEGPGEGRTYQMIPHSWIDKIENRADFLGMLILDLWTNNCDRRQAIFLATPKGRLNAAFIDNGLMFGGKFRNDITCPRRSMVYDLDVYSGLWNDNNDELVKEWLQRIEGIGDIAIRRILSAVPDAWAEDEADRHVIKQLAERRRKLPHMLNEAREALSSSYSIHYHRARNATEPGQILTAPIL